ncbi:Protein of unknown function [Bacillus wiedmannii]|nr:Protein of unknown function [Bacillus wiedmannii]
MKLLTIGTIAGWSN